VIRLWIVSGLAVTFVSCVTAATLNLVAYADPSGCGAGTGSTLQGGTGPGSVDVSGSCAVQPTDLPGEGGSPVLVVDCGYATRTDDHTYWNKQCGPTGFPCPAVPGNPNPHQFMTVFALTQPPVPIAAWCAGATNPMPSAAALRDEVIRLLRPPRIGVSPSTGTGLVNLKTLFWIATSPEVDLGRAKLVGFPVQLRVNYLRTEFDFGDQITGTLAPGPGTAYDPANDCGRCLDRFGHDYTRPGQVTITARVFWQAQFKVGNRAWVTIPGEVSANEPSSTTLTIREARSTLVSPR
jgi:hypothetical protein